MALHDEEAALRSDGWIGALDAGGLTRGWAGGVEAGYGWLPALRLTLALDTGGSSARGDFTGWGPHMAVDPVLGVQHQTITRLVRLADTGQAVGVAWLVRTLDWSRLSLAARLGVRELAGAVERGAEQGPLNTWSWNRSLSGVAPWLEAGVEWEWTLRAAGLPFPLTGFTALGWRSARYGSLTFDYTDASGAVLHGGYHNADGSRRSLDLSGPIFRLGVQVAWQAVEPSAP